MAKDYQFTSIAVLGVGGVGSLVATLLHQIGLEVTAYDHAQPRTRLPDNVVCKTLNVQDQNALESALSKHHAVCCCLPFQLTQSVAKAAHKQGVHYFDLTEDVASTKMIRDLAETSHAVMIPQNGLAPGFIGILGAYLAAQCDKATPIRHIKMRVGALPQHPIGQLGYSGNWSLDGLVHECIAPCEIIADGKAQMIGALKNPEILRIHGVEYEAFTTSGGLGTMTETYLGRVDTLNYKSIRYPGHLDGMKLLLEELRFREDPDALVERLGYALPPDDEDRVLIHASVQGEVDGRLQTKEVVADYLPREIDGIKRTAIAWTTASSLVAVVELVARKGLPHQGFVKQEAIPLTAFLQTQTGRFYAENHPVMDKLMQ